MSENRQATVWPRPDAATARTRRSFLRAALAAGAAALGGDLWIALRRAEEPPTPQFPVTGGALLQPGEAIAFSAPETTISGLLVRLASGEFIAVDRRCPHLGCPVQWSPEAGQFECPCHAAAFEGETGEVVKGAPRTGLRRLAVEMRDGEVWVIGRAAPRQA